MMKEKGCLKKEKTFFANLFQQTTPSHHNTRAHDLADQIGLQHFSRGGGKVRQLVLRKTESVTNNEIQYSGYIGLFGVWTDLISKTEDVLQNVEPQLIQNKEKRDGHMHHLTIITKNEVAKVLKNIEELAQKVTWNVRNVFVKRKGMKGMMKKKISILGNKAKYCAKEGVGIIDGYFRGSIAR